MNSEESRRQQWEQDIQAKLEKFQRNRTQIINELEREYVANKGGDDPFTTCPDCYQESLISHGEYEGICSNTECSSVNPLTECNRCGGIMPGFSWDFGLCESCLEWMDDQ